MIPTLKVIAHTKIPGHRLENWTVLVELDRETIAALIGKQYSDVAEPEVQTVYPIQPLLDRLKDLEIREGQIRQFSELLGKIAQATVPPKE